MSHKPQSTNQVKARLEDEAHKLQEAESQLAKLHAEADTVNPTTLNHKP